MQDEQNIHGFRLSPQQRHLWALRPQETAGAYVSRCLLGVTGPWTPDDLAAALREVTAAEEILRTRFRRLSGIRLPLQVIAESAEPEVVTVDLSDVPEAERPAAFRERAGAFAAAPLDITGEGDAAAGPLRALVAEVVPGDSGAAELLAYLVLPGLCADATGMERLAGRLAAALAGRPVADDEALQYVDVSEWQNELATGEDEDAAVGLEFWRADRLPIPRGGLLEGEAMADDPFAVRSLPLNLDRERTGALEARAKSAGVALHELLLAAWRVLLGRHGVVGADLPVGVVFEGRSFDEVADLVGLLSRRLPLILPYDPASSLAEIARAAAGAREAAEPWQTLFPWHEVPSAVGEPFWPYGFSFRRTAGPLPAGAGEVRILDVESDTDRFVVELDLRLRDGRLEGRLRHDPARFPEASADGLRDRFAVLLDALAAGAGALERPVADLPLATGEAIAAFERMARGADSPAAVGAPPVHRSFFAVADERADAPAVILGERSLSYRQVADGARALADRLRRHGVGRGDVVALLAERSPETVIGIFGILASGAAYVPLDPAYPEERNWSAMADSGARLLVTPPGDGSEEAGRALMSRSAGEDPPALVTIPDPAEAEGAEDGGADSAPGELAYVIYTSGSTGRPKGVAVSHGALAASTRARLDVYGEEPPGRFLLLPSLAFDSSAAGLFWTLTTGGALVLVPEEEKADAGRLAELMRGAEVTHLLTLPSLWSEIVGELAQRDEAALAGLDAAVVAGEACPPAVVGRHAELTSAAGADVPLWNEYGPTEGTVWATVERCAVGDEPVAIGRPVPNARTYVVEPSLAPALPGISGELWIGGPALARGYLGAPAATAERFVPDPFTGASGESGARLYRTGDLARFRPDGRIDFLGRIDHQVKIRGLRVELGEIESQLDAHDSVREAVVVPRGDSPDRLHLVAYVTAAEGGRPEPDALRERLAGRLPAHMVPRRIVVLDVLPRTPGGKVDRSALPEPESEEAEAERVAPRDPIEEVLTGIWSEVLGREPVGARDDFFRLGGHSLMATRVVSRIRSTLGVDMSLPELFAAPTPEAMGRAVARRLADCDGIVSEEPLVPVPRGGDLPLSSAQRRLWILSRLDPDDTAYVVSSSVRLRGDLDREVLVRSLRTIVERHETLRSRFVETDDGPRVVIDPEPVFDYREVSLTGLPEGERETRVREEARRELATPFDLSAGPLLRVRLLRLMEDDHVLLVSNHHSVSDGWSLGVFVGELAELYRAGLRGEAPDLPELPVQYADYADWQRRWFDGEVADRQVEYWRRRLAGAPSALALPTDRPRRAVAGHRSESLSFRWPAEVTAGLRRLARDEGATLFMALVALYQLLLSRYSGQDDVSVGTPVAGRRHVEVEPLVGFFVNTLVLRTDLSGNPTGRELLGRVRQGTLEAFAHQDIPFERLVEEVAPARDLLRSPLFQALFVFQNAPVGELSLEGLELEPFEVDPESAPFELNLWMREAGDSLVGSLQYAADLFDRATAGRLVEHLGNLAREVAAGPDRPASDLPLLGEDERRILLEEWSGASRPARRPAETVHELFGRSVAERPDAVALEAADGQLSYAGLARRADGIAERLAAAGVRRGDPVGILGGRRSALVAGMLGVLRAGAAYVPIDPAYPEDRILFQIEDSGMKILLADEDLLEWLDREGRSGVRVLPLGGAAPTGSPEPGAHLRGEGMSGDDLALIIYTSGSTGTPKGVAITHGGITALAGWAQESLSDGETEGLLASTSVCFDLSVFEVLTPLARERASGGRVFLADDALALASLPGRHRVTLINLVPSALGPLLDLEALPSSVRTVAVAGEPLARSVADRVSAETAAARMLNLYGPSEDTTYSTLAEIDLDGTEAPTIGAPVDGTRLYLLGTAGTLVPAGALGEIHLAGAGLARGYLARPALTAERFVPDPFAPEPGGRLYRTGDLGRHLPDGRVVFTGRIDHQVKLRGYRIELGEVESAVSEHPDVMEAAVQVRGRGDGEGLVCWFAPEAGAEIDAAAIRDHLRRSLPAWMVPSRFVALEALPRTPNGKVDRSALPEPGWDDLATAPGDASPSTPTEEAVVQIWREVLGLEALGIHDDFFDLGGHSLLATQVISRVRSRMGVELPLRALFEHPTVAGLARVADRSAGRLASDERIAAALDDLDHLSDEEVRTLLEAGGAREG